ncbi:MAG: hypothetical protein JF609_03830, partial [Verrucomicrobia bacterium]|nr:hypothetical protein [Verrucomicrobiota bacterium]
RGFTNWLDGDIIPATMSARTEGVVGTNALTYVRNEPSLNVELGTNAATIVVDAQGRIYQPDETALPTVVTTNGSTLILDQAGIGSSTTITARELWAGAAPGSAIINRLVWTNSTSRQWSATAGAVGQALNFTVGGLASNSGYTVRKAGAVFTNVSSTASGQLQIADKGSDTNTAVYYLNLQSANLPPVLPVIADQTINELATLKVTNTATDTETPGSLLTYGLLSAPTNATISASGIISWKPTEAQGPSTNIIVTKVTDDGAPPLSSTNSFMVLVNEVNSAPRLPVQPNLTINAGATLTVTNTATDTDIPANGLTYQLTAAPINAVIDAGGVITWTTPTNQAPSTNLFVTVVTDNGVPPLSATNNFTVTVVAGSEPQAVALRISITPTNTLVISWPAPSTGWTLQRTGDLVTTNGWTDVNQAQVSNIGGENEVIVANLTEKAFYRLKLSQP